MTVAMPLTAITDGEQPVQEKQQEQHGASSKSKAFKLSMSRSTDLARPSA
jgi:hypothetical protein